MSSRHPLPGMTSFPVVIVCPDCHRDLFPLEWDGQRARISAELIEAEEGGEGGALRPWLGLSGTSVRVLSVNRDGGAAAAVGRFRVRCVAPKHQRRTVERVVTQQALDDTCARAIRDETPRVSLLDIRQDTPIH